MKRYIFLLLILISYKSFAYNDRFDISITTHPRSRNGSKHIHWCTMCGADNRYKILKETIQYIEPYVDEIHIIDNGSTDETPSLVNISPKVSYLRIDNWDGNWAHCYEQSIRNVCYGEWFMFHDSDERPSPQMLKNLRSITNWADQNHVNTFAVQSCHHVYDDNGQGFSTYENVIDRLGFVKENFLRRENMKISAFGGHTGFNLINKKSYQIRNLSPHYFYNHYKSVSSVRVSSFTHGFIYPTTFSGLESYAKEIIQLRLELGITKIEQLFDMLHTKKFPQKLLDLVATWQHSGKEAEVIWELIIRDQGYHVLPTECDKPCCDYH